MSSRYFHAGRPENRDLFVTVILDRSGSMEAVRDDTIGAFNAFISDLRAEDARTIVTLTQFDSQSIDVLFDGVDVREVVPLDTSTYRPRGATPLYDAVGTTLERTQERARALGWTGSMLVAIITDGMENASCRWDRARVFTLVEQLQACDWGFVYLGAHADAYAEARTIGVADGSTAAWAHSAAGARAMGKELAASAKGFREKRLAKEGLIDETARRRMERPGG